ncbi:trypsin-like peptidase domain-containing protein [Frigidibacter sp. MR17.14]|uniref:trypsin-like serine peptidase n=1 Tax=Frigidibacter sp. MR17.14 TaxID=3126509 RepID=UPI0030130941
MTPRNRLVLAAALAGLTAAGLPGPGHAAGGQRPLSEPEARPFAAIGRIAYVDAPAPGAAICSGVLVAPDLVLTALHCVIPGRGTPQPDTIRFAIGWRDGSAAALFRGAEVIAPLQRWNEVTDLALLRLAAPVPATLAAPLPLGPQARPGDMLSLVGWRRDAPEAPVRDDLCRVETVVPQMTGLGCEVVSGNSGAPMMTQEAAGWTVREITVATTRSPEGRPKALASDPPADLRAVIATALSLPPAANLARD